MSGFSNPFSSVGKPESSTRNIQTSEQALEFVARQTGTVILAFSRGKDSIAAWLSLRQRLRVVPVHLYAVPELQFIEDSLRYFEDWFKTPIIRLPHPMLFQNLATGLFQSPRHAARLRGARLPALDVYGTLDAFRDEAEPDAWIAFAMSQNDSIVRRTVIKKRGAVQPKKRQVYVNHDWDKARMIEALERSKVRLPVDYKHHGRSFNGLDVRWLGWVKEHFPADWQRLLAWFPLAEVELKRMEFRARHVQESVLKAG